jgi:glycosyltransferase involved in cell wall biosynthesis
MLFSVVIPAHNAESYIGDQLTALAAQIDAGAFEVILVDNRSNDTTVETAKRHADGLDLRIVTAGARPSAAYARNIGAANAKGEFVIFVDADDVVDPHLLAAYRAASGSFHMMGGYYDHVRLNTPKVRAWRPPDPSDALPVAFGSVSYFLMGNSAIERSVFLELDGLDETLTHGGEEVDFSIRAKLAGYEIGWIPDAIVYYRHRGTLRGLSKQWFDYGRAATYVYARYRERMSFAQPTLGHASSALRAVLLHVVDLALGNRRRGRWVRLTSVYAGEIVESLRQGVWYIHG